MKKTLKMPNYVRSWAVSGAIALAALGWSCKGSGVVEGDKGLRKLADSQFLEAVTQTAPRYETLKFVGKGKTEDPNDKLSFKYRIHIEHGKQIWLSFSILGIEGVRALLTQDSVFVLFRLEKKHLATTYNYLEALAGLPMDLPLVERFLVGSPTLAEAAQALPARKETRAYRESNGAYTFDYLFDRKTSLLTKIEGASAQRPERAWISFTNYKSESGRILPYLVEAVVRGPKPMSARFQHNSVEINPDDLTFRYSVPEHYAPLDLTTY